MQVYIDVAQLLIVEFEAEGFTSNIDLVNRRITSLFNSKAVLDTAVGIINMNQNKLSLYQSNILDTVHVLIPTLLTKMSLSLTDDSDYQLLSEQIVQKLRG
jgi:hypothetical protein